GRRGRRHAARSRSCSLARRVGGCAAPTDRLFTRGNWLYRPGLDLPRESGRKAGQPRFAAAASTLGQGSMNYRHAYHAGNFADVVKHVVVARLIEYLKLKDKAFRVLDTHAGIGLYDLSSPEAQKTGEWRGGIGRLVRAPLPPTVATLLAPYPDAVRSVNGEGTVERYPGSPLLTRHLLRRQDRLSAIELHPEDAHRLKALFHGDFQTRVMQLDGWLALGAHLPPKEKRGLVLVDPPFEQEGEFD